jgi:DNA-binding transcriptional LysR family regulator
MELRHFRYFVAVAEELNFTRAAARLGIGQPPLSQQIQALERDVGAKLFRRIPSGAELTVAGQALLEDARTVLRLAETAKITARRAAEGGTGTLRIGFIASAVFNPVVPASIRAFRRAYPSVSVQLEEGSLTRMLECLERRNADVVFVRPPQEELEGVRLHRFADEPMLIAIPSSHPLASRRRVPVSALQGEPLILFPRAAAVTVYDEIISVCKRSGFDPVLGQEAPQLTSVVSLVAAELGVAFVPRSIAQVNIAGVVYLPIEGDAPIARLAAASRADNVSPLVRNFHALLPKGPRGARGSRPIP